MISGFHFCCAPSLLVVYNDILENEPDNEWQNGQKIVQESPKKRVLWMPAQKVYINKVFIKRKNETLPDSYPVVASVFNRW